MKFSLNRPELIWFVLTLLPSLTSAGGNSESSLPTTVDDILTFDTAADDFRGSCLGGSDFFVAYDSDEGCSYDKLADHIHAKLPETCGHNGTVELAILLGGEMQNETVARAALSQICYDGFSAYESTYPWSDVSGYGTEWDKEYYDGNTFWNEEHQTDRDTLVAGQPANVLRDDAQHVDELYRAEAEREPIEFPDFIDNFASCDLRSVMCCWVGDRQAGDNNGNCATPYDEKCTDADPADNTDLCAVDMDRTTSSSSHVDGGFAIWHDNIEGPVHCHGFAWGQDANEADGRFKGNNLFYVSMYDHLYQRGYVREVPGAPMCACVDKMPIVSRADCTEIAEDETWLFTWSSQQYAFTASLERIEIDFNACQGAGRNNDLESFYQRLVNEGRATDAEFEEFKKTVVGNHQCENAIDNLLAEKGYVYDPDPAMEGWTQTYGKGALIPVDAHLLSPESAFTKQGDVNFRHLQSEDSPVFYVLRWCSSCKFSHNLIVYKRLTAIPEDMDFHDLFTSNWRDYPSNINLLDFTLHSSMEDALEDKNPWSFCNYNHPNVGFPRDCGPTNFVGGQWSSDWGGQADVAFYVWNENPSVTEPARPHPSVTEFGDKQDGFCVKANGADQNSGVYRIEYGDFETEELQERCLKMCAAYPGHTGCEAIWNQGNKGCYVHTQEVVSGNGRDNHACWINA